MSTPDNAQLDTTPSGALPWRWPLHWQILLGLLIGAGIGYAIGEYALGQLPEDTEAGDASKLAADIATSTYAFLFVDLLGDMFLNGLKLIIVPLVTSSIILAVFGIGRGDGFGRLGGKTLGYYACTSLVAILIGLALSTSLRPASPTKGPASSKAVTSRRSPTPRKP